MPLVRYEIQNEYKLGSLELYRTASKDDSEGILEGVTMVGLVGILRQLGDLAEFAAELFHDLHEELMATAARGHGLVARVLQIEAELPHIENVLLSDADPFWLSSSPGVDWHATIRSEQNHFTQGDLPRFIRSSYEDCRGPPRLFLLDKFDVGGAEACLKRYTDPSFFKRQWASTELTKAEKAQRERKARRGKKKTMRHSRKGDVNGTTIVARVKPRRVRYSSLSSENMDYFLDSATMQPRENQVNSLSKPKDTAPVVSDKYGKSSHTSMNVSKESSLPPRIPQTSYLQNSKAKAPPGAVQFEFGGMPEEQKQLHEGIPSPRRISTALVENNEEESMLIKEEQENPLQASPLREMALESDRFEDAVAHSEADSDAFKQQLDDEDVDMQLRLAPNNILSGPTNQFDNFHTADYLQDDSSSTARFLKGPIKDCERHYEESGIFKEHTENLRKSVSGIPSETEIYEDAMNVQSDTDSEVGGKQVLENTSGFTESQPYSKFVTTMYPCLWVDDEAENSQQIDLDFIQIQKISPARTHFEEAEAEIVFARLDLSETEAAPDNAREDQSLQGRLHDTNIAAVVSSKYQSAEPSLVSTSEILDESAGKVECVPVRKSDSQLRGFSEAKSNADVLPVAVDHEGLTPSKSIETLVERAPADNVDVSANNVLAFVELTRGSSSELDGFEDALGTELDTSSETSLKQELDAISNLLDSFPDNESNMTQKLSVDSVHGDLVTYNLRRDDTMSNNPENCDGNLVINTLMKTSSSDSLHDGEYSDLNVVLGSHVRDHSAIADDPGALEKNVFPETYLENNLEKVFEKNSQQQPRHAQMTFFRNTQLLPCAMSSDNDQIAAMKNSREIIDSVAAVHTEAPSDFKAKFSEVAQASIFNVSTDSGSQEYFVKQDGQVTVQKIGCSKADKPYGLDEEVPVEQPELGDQPQMSTFVGKAHQLSPLLGAVHLKNVTTKDNMVGSVTKNSKAAETATVPLNFLGPASVLSTDGSYNASHLVTSSARYQDNLPVQESLPDGSFSVVKSNVMGDTVEASDVMGDIPLRCGRESSQVEPFELPAERPAEFEGALLRVEFESKSDKSESTLNNRLLRFTPKSPPLNPIPSFELPSGLHKLSGKSQITRGETSGQLQLDQTTSTLGTDYIDSPAISPIVSPMWSSGSSTMCDEPGEIPVDEFVTRKPSAMVSFSSPSPPSSPAPIALGVQDDVLSDSDSYDSHTNILSHRSLLGDATTEDVAFSSTDQTNRSIVHLTSSCSLPHSPNSQASHVSESEDPFHNNHKVKAYEDLCDDPSLDKIELPVPILKSASPKPSLHDPTGAMLTSSILPVSLCSVESLSPHLQESLVPVKSLSDNADFIKPAKSTSEVEISNQASEFPPAKITPSYLKVEEAILSTTNLEAKPTVQSSSEGRIFSTHEDVSVSLQQPPAKPTTYTKPATSLESKSSPTHQDVSSLIHQLAPTHQDVSSLMHRPAPTLPNFTKPALPAYPSPESKSSPPYKDAPTLTHHPPAPLPPMPPRKPPTGFPVLSRAMTTKAPGAHRHNLADAISMSSLSKLKKVSIQPSSKPRNVNDREVLLEQIRTRSFNLRHTNVEKREVPNRPVPNINVAAILEKANSMRQAVVGSDEDEDSDGWSDE